MSKVNWLCSLSMYNFYDKALKYYLKSNNITDLSGYEFELFGEDDGENGVLITLWNYDVDIPTYKKLRNLENHLPRHTVDNSLKNLTQTFMFNSTETSSSTVTNTFTLQSDIFNVQNKVKSISVEPIVNLYFVDRFRMCVDNCEFNENTFTFTVTVTRVDCDSSWYCSLYFNLVLLYK